MIYLDDNIHDAIEKVAGVRSTLGSLRVKLRIRKGKTLKQAQKVHEIHEWPPHTWETSIWE